MKPMGIDERFRIMDYSPAVHALYDAAFVAQSEGATLDEFLTGARREWLAARKDTLHNESVSR